MDIAAIPFAVNFLDFLKQAIASSKIMIALIGAQWLTKIHQADDYVRMEIEEALANRIPVLPVLIGNTPMPTAEELPETISTIALQNALTVGVLHDFDTHMRMLLPKIESILGTIATESELTFEAEVIFRACDGVIHFLKAKSQNEPLISFVTWKVIGSEDFLSPDSPSVT